MTSRRRANIFGWWTGAGLAAAVFTLLGFITWSYRDVANRHSNKTGGDAHHTDAGHGHH